MPKSLSKYFCPWCARETALRAGERCPRCASYVDCGQCGRKLGAPPKLGACERCRWRNRNAQQLLVAAARAVLELELDQVAERSTYPFRGVDFDVAVLRVLALAARPLQAAVRRVLAGGDGDAETREDAETEAELAALRAAPRKPPVRADRSAGTRAVRRAAARRRR